MTANIVIIGTGLAGYNLARELRKHDTATPLTLISRDGAGFYSKPMLSNALAGNKTATTLVMKPVEKMAEELNATILARSDVNAIDPAAHTVTLADGSSIAYGKLVLAQGADPIRLPLAGDASADVLSVNDLDDYARFADKLEGVRSVAILGGGLIGCEFANDLLARGITPTVLDVAQWPLSRLVPQQAGDYLAAKLTAAGVQFRFGVAASAVDKQGSGYRITLDDGSRLDADLVLSAIGLRPRTQLAQAAGLTVQRGVVVNRLLQTSSPDIYALGDTAEVEGLNLPFVMPIMQQARALGATLAGNATELKYPAMPVVVKTPACPTVVALPAAGAAGQWWVEASEAGVDARFVAADGSLLGFALLGEASKQRQALAPSLPAVLG
ncbi:rubredoxin-NAD+ reductase [Andreprevotia lacus DSM 23236]|jgi:rubredoxin-NAD+ reductase|uniref:Rubredoxin-NAD+ reductase n=1 Tax=Andreprevotia lacus DSM 23236 TaxID=1121001 RepID=A0A1W1XNI2_9NEIS|nr:FAD-dependent oxidoreductase [Andreprevotia lacus]SMC25071.1 rubredoxin-NAD+ reductase [Andreprevotia lacus DSM 23236]